MTTQLELELPQACTDIDPTITDDYFNMMSSVEHLPQERLPVRIVTPGPYLREAGTNHAHVQLLADASSTSALPPILVQRSTHRVIDGMHRLAAAKLRGEETINACLIDCTDEEALVLAIRSNTLHGLPLSKADRISGAKRILVAHPDWSDRAVASVTGMSAKTIAVLRNRSSGEVISFEKRLGRDGKRRPVTPAMGRKRAAAYLDAHPDASLREVAREADVSVGTVHTVRRLMRHGADLAAQDAVRPEPTVSKIAARPDSTGTARQSVRTIGPSAQELRLPRQQAWSAVSFKIANDPALRYTEGGRAFLRWMAQHALHAEDWRELVSAVPVHWAEDVGAIAESVSAEWHMFAAQLRRRSAPQSQ
jgi:ParB-like chromosome segregation protein Spo0J